MPECTFVFLTNPRDIEFVDHTLRHLLRMCSFHFREIILVADDLPKGTQLQSHENSDAKFSRMIQELQRNGTITRCVRLSAIDSDRLAGKYFGSRVSAMRDHRGIPLFGWIAGLEAAQTDFVLHFDSDILLHQAPGHSWIDAGIPPASDGSFYDQAVAPTFDNQGNFRFKNFSSRRFLMNKPRFENMLPTPLRYLSTKRRLFMQFGFDNALCTWEHDVTCVLQNSKYYRVHLRSPKAWALHCRDHGRAWLRSLPALIKRVEDGRYPAEQGGHYNLMLPAWT
jgi:hypothetical protein